MHCNKIKDKNVVNYEIRSAYGKFIARLMTKTCQTMITPLSGASDVCENPP